MHWKCHGPLVGISYNYNCRNQLPMASSSNKRKVDYNSLLLIKHVQSCQSNSCNEYICWRKRPWHKWLSLPGVTRCGDDFPRDIFPVFPDAGTAFRNVAFPFVFGHSSKWKGNRIRETCVGQAAFPSIILSYSTLCFALENESGLPPSPHKVFVYHSIN